MAQACQRSPVAATMALAAVGAPVEAPVPDSMGSDGRKGVRPRARDPRRLPGDRRAPPGVSDDRGGGRGDVHPRSTGGPFPGAAARRLLRLNPWLKRLPPRRLVDDPSRAEAREAARARPLLVLFRQSLRRHGLGLRRGRHRRGPDTAPGGPLWRVFRAPRARPRRPPAAGSRPGHGRRSGVAGMLASVVGLSTGPCSVMGCGAPVLPVVGSRSRGCRAERLRSWRACRESRRCSSCWR